MRSRLKAARLVFSKPKSMNEDFTYLAVYIDVMELKNKKGFAFSARISYMKRLSDPAVSDRRYYVPTWDERKFGVTGPERP